MANEHGNTHEQGQAYRVRAGGFTLTGFASLEGAARWVTDTLRAGRAYRIERCMGSVWQLAIGNDGAGTLLGVAL